MEITKVSWRGVGMGVLVTVGIGFAIILSTGMRQAIEESKEDSPWIVLRQDQAFFPNNGKRTITILQDKITGKCYIDSKSNFGGASISPIECPE